MERRDYLPKTASVHREKRINIDLKGGHLRERIRKGRRRRSVRSRREYKARQGPSPLEHYRWQISADVSKAATKPTESSDHAHTRKIRGNDTARCQEAAGKSRGLATLRGRHQLPGRSGKVIRSLGLAKFCRKRKVVLGHVPSLQKRGLRQSRGT